MLTFTGFQELGVDVVVTTRAGGVSTGPYCSLNLGLHVGDDPVAVLENRRRAAAAVGAQLEELVFAEQVHGRQATIVTRADQGRGTRHQADAVPGTDALVTADVGVTLAVQVADCAPIVLFDPVTRILAGVHSGWRGAFAGIAAATIDAMTSLGARPDRLVAGIGPAVPADRYQVGPEVVDAAEAALGAGVHAAGVVRADGTGRWLLDVAGASHDLLVRSGVPEDRIQVAGVGTGPPGPFFSHRAARPCGRFALLARMHP